MCSFTDDSHERKEIFALSELGASLNWLRSMSDIWFKMLTLISHSRAEVAV